jgi:hypothetical protein
MRSIIFTGYSYKEDLYINILITETLPKFPPIYGAVYISEVPWVPLWGHKGDWLKYMYSTPLLYGNGESIHDTFNSLFFSDYDNKPIKYILNDDKYEISFILTTK